MKFYEEGDIVEFKVDGQSTDFNSEGEEGEVANSSDSEMDEGFAISSENNNANKLVDKDMFETRECHCNSADMNEELMNQNDQVNTNIR